eukprot:7451571-Alexandrium_andersonii.AAC.1
MAPPNSDVAQGSESRQRKIPGGIGWGLGPKCPPGLQAQRKCTCGCAQVHLCVPTPAGPSARVLLVIYVQAKAKQTIGCFGFAPQNLDKPSYEKARTTIGACVDRPTEY